MDYAPWQPLRRAIGKKSFLLLLGTTTVLLTGPVANAFLPQQQQHERYHHSFVRVSTTTTTSTSTSAQYAFPVLASPTTTTTTEKKSDTVDGAADISDTTPPFKTPFIIDALSDRPNPAVFKEIADMCIDAFFHDTSAAGGGGGFRRINSNSRGGRRKRSVAAPWKEYQLAYLRSLQENDLLRRRREQPDTNVMLVAREVIRAGDGSSDDSSYRNAPLILDYENVYNWEGGDDFRDVDMVRGPILGFVEVTQKPYGLGQLYTNKDKKNARSRLLSLLSNNNNSNDNNNGARSDMILHPARPFLTNLSVRYDVRKSGIGSALAERCEREVVKRWNQYEIVLEVEEDNERALEFYKKRGYEIVFVDPTGRRYDVSGLWLQQKRCKRYVLRKELTSSPVEMATEEVKSTLDRGIEALLRLRESVFQGKSIKLL